MTHKTISIKEAAKIKKTSIPTIMNWIGNKIIAEKNPRWIVLVDECFKEAKKGKSLGKDLQKKVAFVSQKIAAGTSMKEAVVAYEGKADQGTTQIVVNTVTKKDEKNWGVGQDVLWCDTKNKSNRMGVICNIKKRVQVQFQNGEKSWVAKSNLRVLNEPAKFYSPQIMKKSTTAIPKPNFLEKKVCELEQQILALQEEVRRSIAERDKARAYRIDLENEKNEMRTQIVALQEDVEEKKEVIQTQKSQIEELKERLYEQHSRANRSEFENEKLAKALAEYRNDLSDTRAELEQTMALKHYNQVEKLSLQDQIAERAEQVVYIPSNSNIAKRREEDIAAGKPVSDNIQVIDVEALQQQLFRQAKEKYKNHAFVKVMNETLRKKAENEKKVESEI
ncbi:hypothetical protein [Candidatus Uabimicrobium amorphum]|uniref:Uncharacterized protein n=2 Tax=Uabimicrobium amorphum TaxID=2596890 RepID=A0A5S9IJT2_UABAM|nr:hypothetical protein UABAM_01504 [Candidatus Uabimicrobium amorphum]